MLLFLITTKIYKRFSKVIVMKEEAFKERRSIRNGRYGLAKLIWIESVPLVMGATLGSIGRATGEDIIPAVPLAIDLMWGSQDYLSLRGLWSLVKYGTGVSLPYADKIYLAAQALSDKF